MRDRVVCVGACPRDENTARVKVKIKRARSAERVVRLPRQRVNSVRALEQVRNKDEKVPLFCDEPPHFFEKDVAFSQRVLGRHDKVQCLFTKF